MATLPNHNPPPFGAATTTPALNWVPAGPAMEKRRTESFSPRARSQSTSLGFLSSEAGAPAFEGLSRPRETGTGRSEPGDSEGNPR